MAARSVGGGNRETERCIALNELEKSKNRIRAEVFYPGVSEHGDQV